MSIFINSYSVIGLKFKSSLVTESAAYAWVSPNTTPQFVDLEWTPDFPDPVGQQLMPMFDVLDGGAFGGNEAWIDNSTLQNYFTHLDFENSTVQKKDMKIIYNITNNLSADVWLPVPYVYYFVQPYVHGFVLNTYVGYFYNMMYISYSNSGTLSNTSLLHGYNVSVLVCAPNILKSFSKFNFNIYF